MVTLPMFAYIVKIHRTSIQENLSSTSHLFRKIELITIEENLQTWDSLLVCCEEMKKLGNTAE